MSIRPYLIVSLSAASYAGLFQWLQHGSKDSRPSSVQSIIKAISAGHSGVMTLLVLYALKPSLWHTDTKQTSDDVNLNYDDSTNPLIVAQSRLANNLSAWETGYLIYDTCLLVLQTSPKPTSNLAAAVGRAARKSPALLLHHAGLAVALLVLQVYISHGRERGMWIIMAFFLMNASTPAMHALWWAKKSGHGTKAAQVAFAIVFAACRFGVVWWVLRKYGRHHGVSAIEAYTRLRAPCKIGTGALFGMNGIWWLTLLRNIVTRK
jgi:hypothetical protein